MIALKIAEVKDFMNKLLCQDVFDHFLIQEAVITTNVSCHIDGTLQKDFYTLEELEEQNLTGLFFVPYGLLRSSCFNLIKGKKTPSYFKFSLLLSPENLKRTLSQTGSSFTENDISAVFLNIRFQNGELQRQSIVVVGGGDLGGAGVRAAVRNSGRRRVDELLIDGPLRGTWLRVWRHLTLLRCRQ